MHNPLAFKQAAAFYANRNQPDYGYIPQDKVAFTDARDTGANITIGGKQYAVYETAAGKYYYLKSTGVGAGVGSELPVFLDDEKDADIIKDIEWQIDHGAKREYSDKVNFDGQKVMSNAAPVAPAGDAKPQAIERPSDNWAESAPEADTGSNSGGISDALINQLFDRINKLDDDNAKLREQLTKPPEKHGAQFWADKIGLDYDLAAILQEYNDRTNTFYNELNANTELLRNNYIKNTGLYNENLINNYIDSYKNAAQTTTNKRATAASALAMLINQNNQNNLMEYDTANELEANKVAQRTALAQHPYEAEEYYNKVGTYLSGIEGLANTEDVKNYVNQLDAYSSKYAATQNARATGYLANAEKYAGLANAAKTAAASTSDAYTNNKLQQMWNLYYGLTGSNTKASTAIKNLTTGSVGIVN